jgi:hypothetical protein
MDLREREELPDSIDLRNVSGNLSSDPRYAHTSEEDQRTRPKT